ncbi:transcription factor domain-containing protein [Aspergillus lucknowensis]|uniref:Fungal-specific transcription factor domain-containing protein n=1 Tax=Aspergillus lucknowensis TaxID=176173 RepID=A0ABR4L5U5_9EURO
MDRPTRIRKRVPKSCRRCHRRKQRCVGFPTCANCDAANEPCLRSETSPSWHHGMSKGALAQRIEALEAHLSATCGPGTEKSPSIGGVEGKGGKERATTAYLGPSSGVTITENLSRIVEDAGWSDRLIPVHGVGDDERGPNISPAPTSTAEQEKAAPPEDGIGMQLLDAYFTSMHVRLPFLHRMEILELHARRYQAPDGEKQDRYGMFKLFMVYAIGAAMLQMNEQYAAITPSAYFATALQHDSTVRETLSVAGVEARLLMVIYNLRSNSRSSVWYTIGMAMRICIDLGMHRESHYNLMDAVESQLCRRLFWSVYVIERHVSWALGRPFSIAEGDIDTQLPVDIDLEDLASTENSRMQAALVELAPGIVEGGHIPAIRRFIATVQLQRIMSRIHTKIYRVNRHMPALLPQLSPLLASLEEYKASLPPLEPHDNDFIRMHWNNGVRALLQPFLNILKPEDDLIRTCLRASGEMCQSFKRSQQKGVSGHSFLLANSVYLAGLTMCFCLFRAPRLWTTRVANDLRACSSAIFVTAERNTSFRKSRDDLENMINRAMDFVHEMSTQNLHLSGQPAPAAAAGAEGLPGPEFNAGSPAARSSGLELPHVDGMETQEDLQSAQDAFGDFFAGDLWAAETANHPTFDLFGFDWNGLGFQQ